MHKRAKQKELSDFLNQIALYFYNNSNNVAILLPLRTSKRRKAFIYGLFRGREITPTLFRDYHLYYFISILSNFVLFRGCFSLSYSLYLLSCCKICCNYQLLNSTRRFSPFIISQTKSPTFR